MTGRVLGLWYSVHATIIAVVSRRFSELTSELFIHSHRACIGICGSCRLADVGGPPYLVPTVNRAKLYNLADIARSKIWGNMA